MAIKNVYGFTEDGKRVKICDYLEVFPVGGRIFYIDDTSSEVVAFYDANRVKIDSVAVGDSPVYYDIVTQDPNDKPKYYVYYDERYSSLRWTYLVDGTPVYNLVGTLQTIGSGKGNTSAVMSADNGAYVDDEFTIWHKIKELRDNKLANCDDWFVGSIDEMEELRLFVVNNSSEVTDFFTNDKVITSSESHDDDAWQWNSDVWNNSYNKEYMIHKMCPIRSF